MTKIRPTFIPIVLALFMFGHFVNAQNDSIGNTSILWNRVEAFTHTKVALPETYESTKGHTLIIALHGYGSTSESFLGLSESFTEAGFIFAAPEAPYRVVFENGSSGYEWFLYDVSSHILLERPASDLEKSAMRLTAENLVGQVMRDLKDNYNINKVYLLGFSQGGIIAYLAGIHHHKDVDGLIVFSSAFTKDWLGDDSIEQGKELKTLIIQGETDVLVPVKFAEDSRDLLIENGYDVTYKKFDGGHTIPTNLFGFVIEWINKG